MRKYNIVISKKFTSTQPPITPAGSHRPPGIFKKDRRKGRVNGSTGKDQDDKASGEDKGTSEIM